MLLPRSDGTVIPIHGEHYSFDSLDELYKTAEELPDVDRHEVYAHHEDRDEWSEVPYRDSLWTDDGRTTGVVSSNQDFYNIIQYQDILQTVGDAVQKHRSELDLSVDGHIDVSPTAHKMSAEIDFHGDTTVYADQGDPIDLGLKVRSGHSGYHGLKYDIGAERQVCSNGMMAFVSDLHFEQTHGDPFQTGLAYSAVDAVVESPEIVEERIHEAQSRELLNQDEALLVLLDLGLDRYLDQPVPDLVNALHSEVEDETSPTLWETYNAATRALTHYTSEDVPDYELDTGFEAAAELLETGYNAAPEPDRLARSAVESRSNQLVEDQETERYWDGEDETLRELMEAREVQA